MSVSLTPDEARGKRLCPNAALIGTEKTQTPFCHGPACGAWRWTLDQAYRDAVKKEADRTGEKGNPVKAAQTVAAKPVSFNLRGYCGLGGQP